MSSCHEQHHEQSTQSDIIQWHTTTAVMNIYEVCFFPVSYHESDILNAHSVLQFFAAELHVQAP